MASATLRVFGGYGLDGDGLRFGSCTPLCNPTITSCAPSWPRCGDGTIAGALALVCGDFVCDAPESSIRCPGDCT